MKAKAFLKRNIFSIIVATLTILALLFFAQENAERTLVLILSVIGWFLICVRTRSLFTSSLLYILIVLPLNITYQLPTDVLFFHTDSYVTGINTNYLIPTLSILDFGLVLLLISYMHEFGVKHTKILLYSYSLWIILFTGYLIFSAVLNSSLLILFNGGRVILAFVGLILTIDFFRLKKWKKFGQYMLVVLLVSVLIQGIIGILQFKTEASLGLGLLGESQVVGGMQGSSFVTLNNEVFLRAYGTFPHPNILGGYFVVCLLISLYLYMMNDFKWKRGTILLGVLSSVFVVFTFSRICMALVLIAWLVFLFFKFVAKKKRIYSFAIGLIAERFLNLLSGADTSWSDRINLMRCSLGVIRENWLMGIGLGRFTKGMENNIPLTLNGVMLIQPVHSVPLLIISELGILGALLYCVLLGNILLRNAKRMSWFRWLVIFVLIVIGGFDHYLFSLPQGIVISVILLSLVVL
jgi:hypothetical protein